MAIPVISNNVLETLEYELESGFSSDVKANAEERLKKGVYAMELLLGIGNDSETGSFRSKVRANWLSETENKSLNVSLSPGEARFKKWLTLIAILSVILSFCVLFYNANSSINFFLFLILLGFGILALPVFKRAKKNKYKALIAHSLVQAQQDLMEWDLFEASPSTSAYSISDYIAGICQKLGVDPTEARVGLGKATGRGSTFIGWGSGRAIGIGIGLSAVSGIANAAKKSAINGRIKELETFIFYNNVAMYFNSDILPGLLSERPALLQGAPGELLEDAPLLELETGSARYTINEKCDSCGECVPYCPGEAVTRENGRYVIDNEKCLECGSCASCCEKDAITVT